jgi:hypothetical protein
VATLLLILVPALVFTAAVVGAIALRRRADVSGRPWPGTWPAWVAVVAALTVLGLVVAPRLLGITFLFLPFVWIGGLGRRRQQRRPGHE